MKKVLSVFCALFFCMQVFAAEASDLFFTDFVSRSWTTVDGLPGNSITDLIQSMDGYLYIGTYGGLVRFDGMEFVTFNRSVDPKYSFMTARSVMEDSRGNIWVGSNDEGAFCHKPDGNLIAFTTNNGLPNNSIRSFCEDKDGNIWIGTSVGIACVSGNLEVIEPAGFEKIPNNNHFIASQLYCDTAGRIWIVTGTENNLYVYYEQEFHVYDGIKTIKNPAVTTVAQEAGGAFWFGIAPNKAVRKTPEEELSFYVGNKEQRGNSVNSIYQDSSLNVWFALDNGVTVFHEGKFSYYTKPAGRDGATVAKIIEDREKNIWFATDLGGIERLSYSKFQTTFMSTTVNAIAQDTNRDVVWIAGDDGLYCYSNGKFIDNEITDYCKNVRVRHVAMTREGDLLVSTYEKLGQIKFSKDGKIQSWKKTDGLAGNKVRVCEQMRSGDLFVGTTTGLSIIGRDGSIKNITTADKITNDYIMCIFEDDEGSVWIGTDGGGVFILKDGKISRTLTKEDGLAGNVIFKIAKLNDKEIWICTGTGASCLRGGKILSFDSSDGLGTDSVFQLLGDYSKNIWGTSNRGVFCLNRDELESFFAGKKAKLNTKFYSDLDGISSAGVTSTSLCMRDSLGRIWFTLVDGFTIYDPVRNASNKAAPEVKIQHVYIDGIECPLSGKIVIGPEAKRLNIKYTGISLVSSEQVRFKTKLEGFDSDYGEWTSERLMSYTNLKPGSYTFNVIAKNGDEIQSRKSQLIMIVKKPYFWQTKWFIALVCILGAGLVVLVYVLRLNSFRREKKKNEKFTLEITLALVGTIDAKDKYTKGHSNRVAEYSKMICSQLGHSEEYQKKVYYSALLHDIGKIGVPDAIINKPGKLNDEEFSKIKEHPVIGSQILKAVSSMAELSVGARSHHERFDGKGYPDGLSGTNIPRIARIICVADAYDAMTSNRSYRQFLPQEVVRRELEKNKGSQFDPEIVDVMLSIMEKDVFYRLHE